MSYVKKSNQQYRRNLRQAWEAGMAQALSQIDDLKKEGWIFEVNRGAMTQKQAAFFMKIADRMGNETISVPVTDSANPVVFVGYKPQKGVPPQAIPAKRKKKQPKQPKPTIDPFEEWQNIYYKKNPQDMEEKEGAIMDPSRVMAVLRPGATNQSLASILEKALNQTFKSAPLQYSKITAAEKAAKNAGEELKYIKFAEDSHYLTKNVKAAMRALGFTRTKEGATAYLSEKTQPVAIVDDSSGWSVLIAPMISEVAAHEVATIEVINK